MIHGDSLGLLLGAIALGGVHGIEPGHGWPVAASYALERTNKWLYGFAASLILGIGHLVSSIAMVAVFFYAKAYFSLTQVNDPITILGGIRIGGPVSLVAGVLLIVLGIRESTKFTTVRTPKLGLTHTTTASTPIPIRTTVIRTLTTVGEFSPVSAGFSRSATAGRTRPIPAVKPPNGVSSGSRGSRSSSDSHTKRSSRSSLSAPAPTTVSN